MRSWIVAGIAGLAVGCGGSAGFTGTVQGQSFTPKDSASNSVPVSAGSTSTLGLIFVVNAAGFCSDATANQSPKNLAGLIITVEDVNLTTGATTAPTAPGTYVLSGSAAKYAFVAFETTDASCKEITAQSATGASGTVTITSVSNGAYAGNLDVIFDSGDHLTGSFSASACAAINAAFGSSSTATCI